MRRSRSEAREFATKPAPRRCGRALSRGFVGRRQRLLPGERAPLGARVDLRWGPHDGAFDKAPFLGGALSRPRAECAPWRLEFGVPRLQPTIKVGARNRESSTILSSFTRKKTTRHGSSSSSITPGASGAGVLVINQNQMALRARAVPLVVELSVDDSPLDGSRQSNRTRSPTGRLTDHRQRGRNSSVTTHDYENRVCTSLELRSADRVPSGESFSEVSERLPRSGAARCLSFKSRF